MEKPKITSSADAMRWNADVERRRREHHESRCAEDPIYKRAYERQQETVEKMRKMNAVDMLRLRDALDGGDTKLQQKTPEKAPEPPTEDVRAAIRELSESLGMPAGSDTAGNMLAFAALAMVFGETDMEERLRELEEERPYAEEIRKADEAFDSEIIRLGGFVW